MIRVSTISTPLTMLKVLTTPVLCGAARRYFKAVFTKFFALQYKAARKPGLIPVASVDHTLDATIPFSPKWVAIYLDFVPFWIRIIGFLLKTYKQESWTATANFIDTMGQLYNSAAEVYARHLSTTRRPRYLGSPRFIVIHAFDPHLMCIPSLHVMVVIRAYTKFRAIVQAMGDEQRFSAELDAAQRHAITITESLLHIKQHSINCVAAAMYAMTCFDAPLFPPEEARCFVDALFATPDKDRRPPEMHPDAAERVAIQGYIWRLYQRFVEAGTGATAWEEPLLAFLRENPAAL
ncbi:MAG: hypothetical protein LBJ41_03725 [Treponema sp.]|nr:hypothetical protein [Treponema sp.]